MDPRILNIDRNHFVGKFIGEYADNWYWVGFRDGFVIGATGVFTILTVSYILTSPTILKKTL